MKALVAGFVIGGLTVGAVWFWHAKGLRPDEPRRIVVATPEQWPEGEYRNCYLDSPGYMSSFDPDGTRNDQAHLDCDRFVKGELIHHTPPDHFLVLDVRLSGINKPAGESNWTCQRDHGYVLECRR